ncbi:MAG: hypothetical protein Q9195_004095 [Heterodermia aff. obscurata]
MYSEKPHHLLAQVPLTVSPFISLPTATTLPYTYKPLPSTLPPSSTADSNGVEREDYVVSASGHAASPEDIIKSCQALQDHIKKTQEDAEKAIQDWEQSLIEQDLAEKRRLAPGWLDRSEKILEPERRTSVGFTAGLNDQATSASIMDSDIEGKKSQPALQQVQDPAGDELDRAFGGMTVRKG